MKEAVQDRMGWGGRENLSLQHEGCTAPVSWPTDKELILWGRGAVSVAEQEGREKGIWKEQGGFQERDGEGRDVFSRGEE